MWHILCVLSENMKISYYNKIFWWTLDESSPPVSWHHQNSDLNKMMSQMLQHCHSYSNVKSVFYIGKILLGIYLLWFRYWNEKNDTKLWKDKSNTFKEKEWNLTVQEKASLDWSLRSESPELLHWKNPRRAYEDSSRQLHPGLPSLWEVCSSDLLFNSRRKEGFLPVQRKRVMKPHMVVGSQVKSRQFF